MLEYWNVEFGMIGSMDAWGDWVMGKMCFFLAESTDK